MGTITTLLVFRHGQTPRNAAGNEIQGWIDDADAELNESGIAEAQKIGEALSNYAPEAAAIYTSDLKRSCKTAEIVAKCFKDQPLVFKDQRAREKCHGKWDTLNPKIRNEYCINYYKDNDEELKNQNDRFAKWKIEPLSLGEIEPVLPNCKDNLESIYDVWQRGTALFKELGEMHRGETILISSHGAFNDTMATEAEHRGTTDLLPVYFEPKARHFPKNCAVYLFQYDSATQEISFSKEISF